MRHARGCAVHKGHLSLINKDTETEDKCMEKTKQKFITVFVLIAVLSLPVVKAGNPHWQCFGKFVTIDCDYSCNCPGPIANCCLEWQGIGLCSSCLSANQWGWDECVQDEHPDWTLGKFRAGDCKYKFEIEYTKDCSECETAGEWIPALKRCDSSCGS